MTGAEVLVSGRVSDFPSAGNIVNVVRETRVDESGCMRLTHLSFAVPLIGRAELIVAEQPLDSKSELPNFRGFAFRAPVQ